MLLRSNCCSDQTIMPVSCLSGAVLARSPAGCVFAPRARVSLLSLLFKLAELGIQAPFASVEILRLAIDCVRVVEH